MRRKTKIIFGITALLTVVSMNIRHAWMNYGIAKDNIIAGVAGDPSIPTIEKDTTQDTIVIILNKEIVTTKFIVCCPVKEVFYYYNYDNGKKTQIAKGEKDLRTGQLLIQPYGADIIGAIVEEGAPICDDFISIGKSCGNYEPGTICSPESANIDCNVLIKATTL